MKGLSLAIVASVVLACLESSPASAQTDSWVQSNSGAAGAPAPRAGHSFVGGDGPYAYLFGGAAAKYLPADLWRYDYLSKSWTLLPASGPGPRKGAASSFGAGKVVIFGGASGLITAPYWHDTWFYTEATGKWTNTTPPKCTNARPCPTGRNMPAMAYDPFHDDHVLFGGFDGTSYLGDTWIYRVSSGKWTQAQLPTGSSAPAGRWQAALAYAPSPSKIVMFGGVDNTHLFADLWSFDGSVWTSIPQANIGPALRGMGMVYDLALGKLVIFGGEANPFNSLAVSGDTWTFDFATHLWENLGTTTGLAARTGSPLAYLPKFGVRVFACGVQLSNGTTSFVNDTWEGR